MPARNEAVQGGPVFGANGKVIGINHVDLPQVAARPFGRADPLRRHTTALNWSKSTNRRLDGRPPSGDHKPKGNITSRINAAPPSGASANPPQNSVVANPSPLNFRTRSKGRA